MVKLVDYPQSHFSMNLLAFFPKVGEKIKMSEIQINRIC